MKLIICTALLLLFAQAAASDPPAIVWGRLFLTGSLFYHVEETSNGGFIVAGRAGEGPNKSVFLFDSNGNLVWDYGVSGYDYYQSARWVEELPSGEFIATGSCRLAAAPYTYELFIARIDADGNEVWAKQYDVDESTDIGYCILPLPDGGFAVCGVINPFVGMDQAWILRTDASGDTLWTRQWGWIWNDDAKRVLYDGGDLTVLIQGRLESTSGGPHIVKYNLDGNLLSETPIPDLYGEKGGDMCLSPTDDCYTMITYYHPDLCHVDDLGNVLWSYGIPGASQPYGYSINSTMDGGYIYGGQNTPDPDIPGSQYSGMIVKFDSVGQEMWRDYVYNSSCRVIYSIMQLSQGGYIAAGYGGSKGLLIRYTPEVGIEEGSTLPAQVTLHQPTPNPFTSSLSVSYSLPVSMQISLSVYDASGRFVGELENTVMDAGEYTSEWDAGVLPSGCYVIRLVTEQGEFVRSCVLIR